MSKVITYTHKNKSGIYRITNSINDDIYIGSSKDLYNRKTTHIYYLLKNKHHSYKLQSFINVYGIESLHFEILILLNKNADLIKYEKEYIKYYNPFYNIDHTLQEKNNYCFSEAIRNKMSIRFKGRKMPKRTLRYRNTIRRNNSKPVLQYDLNNNFIKKWKSSTEAARELNLNISKIKGCANYEKYRHSTGGFIWKNEPKQLKLNL
jgi:excinuclease UvrABC nuclease subunit